MSPSQYMFQMNLDTEKKLDNQHTMNIPKKIELLDMSEQSHQRVRIIMHSFLSIIQCHYFHHINQ
jgi:hypothetical protein